MTPATARDKRGLTRGRTPESADAPYGRQRVAGVFVRVGRGEAEGRRCQRRQGSCASVAAGRPRWGGEESATRSNGARARSPASETSGGNQEAALDPLRTGALPFTPVATRAPRPEFWLSAFMALDSRASARHDRECRCTIVMRVTPGLAPHWCSGRARGGSTDGAGAWYSRARAGRRAGSWARAKNRLSVRRLSVLGLPREAGASRGRPIADKPETDERLRLFLSRSPRSP